MDLCSHRLGRVIDLLALARHVACRVGVVLAVLALTAGCGGSGQAAGAPDQAYDYQHMGLTSEQYDELRKIEKAARALQAKGKLPPTWVRDRSREACTRILAAPKPTTTEPGWPQ